ncbi:hypothetical protein L1987_63985 [Smallanthus sonchifolius]|uniref:Uncharacterized protein n=1 Tax=Smallanthus sonchifolius TaxID=185202 RepID=A0ACB9CF69_9ASTR|nr:hypothetical protein L1987_63985 [Smallanthus sonchifolius]
MTDVEHEAPKPEDDPEVVVGEEPEAPMEAEPKMEARVPVMRRPSFQPYCLRPGGALFMFTPRKQILPPRKRKLAPAFGEEDTVPPPLSPKRARAADIIEDDDTSDEEPPSTFDVGGTSQPPYLLLLTWRLRTFIPLLWRLGVRFMIISWRGTNSGAGGGGTSGNMNGSGNENGGGSGGGNGNGTGNTSGAGGSGTRGVDTNAMASPAHPIYISDDDEVHEVIVILDPKIFNVSDDEAEVEPDVLEAGDESEPESDYEDDPEDMTDVEHEAPEPEDDPEVVVGEEPEAPMEAEPEMEARVPVMRRPSFRPYRLRPGGALFMFTPRKQILPPRKRKLAPAFGEEDTVPPPPSPKRARAADIIEDDDTSDEEPPSTFEVGGTSQPPVPVTANMETEDVDPPTLAVRCEIYDHQLESLRGVTHAI